MLVSEVWPDEIPEPFLYGDDWRCRKRVYADLSTACLPNDSLQGEQKAASLRLELPWPQTGSPKQWKLLNDWYFVIMPQVQVAGLTYILDKLPCIQGIAELFKKAIGCNYLAGHWEMNLIESLDWPWSDPIDMASHTNTTPVAPSWSLASVHGKTWHHVSSQKVFPVAEFLGASGTTVSNGPTIVRDPCRLRIKGPAYRLGMDINEVIHEGVCEDLTCTFRPGSSWPPGLWHSKNAVTEWDCGVPIYSDSHQSSKMEASIHRHKDTRARNGNGYLITVREDSALFLVTLTVHRGLPTMLSGIVTRQVSEEPDGPVLERIGHWEVDLPESERARFADESFIEGMRQTVFYLV